MKTLKLNQIEKSILDNKAASAICGGGRIAGMCGCGCNYENSGGSSTFDNGMANADTGAWSGDKFLVAQPVIIRTKSM